MTRLQGKDKELCLQLVRKALRWLPEERATAAALRGDEFLLEANSGEGAGMAQP